MRTDKRFSQKVDKKGASRVHRRGIVGYSKKSALLEEAITHMNTGKYGRSSAALKELLAVDPQNIEARRLFATLHLRLGSLVTARQAFESLANEAIGRQDYWLAESLLREYLAAGPRCVPFLEQLSYVYQEKGDEMAAVAELGKAIEILRDDPDADNPQKASQLYAKIRELAPASSVALQLAPLFDVQSGQFLVQSSTSPTNTADDNVCSDDPVLSSEAAPTHAVVEHPLPDIMPWEMLDEPAAEPESEAHLTSTMASVEVHEVPPPPAPEHLQPPTEFPSGQATVVDSVDQEPSFTFTDAEQASPEVPSDDSLSGITAVESPTQTVPDIPSPMPWEQMADASIQITEPEISPEPIANSPLEAIPTLLRTEDACVEPSPLLQPPPVIDEVSPIIEEIPPSAPIDRGQGTEPTPVDAGETGSPPLSAPMPWEQISDPAIQIPVAETAPPLSTEELLTSMPLTAPDTSGALAMSDDVTLSPPIALENEVPSTETTHSSESSTPSTAEASPAEPPPTTSFSWNSIFDKAWKFTADTMAPSPTVPLEKNLELSEEPQHVEERAVEEGSSVAGPLLIPPLAQEEPSSPVESAMTVSFPAIADEQQQEVASAPPVAPSSQPVEPSPLQQNSLHWNTGEVAVQVHRPSKKKKRWAKEPEDVAPAPEPPSAPESLSEPHPEAIREWKPLTEPVAPQVEEVVITQAADTRPAWMQATEAITFTRPEPPPQARWSDADKVVPPVSEAASAAAVSAVDTLFSPSPTIDDPSSQGPLSWSKPRPRFIARLHRVRIGISSFIGSCFSTTRSLSFLTLMITIAIVVVAAAGTAAVAVMWMAMEDSPSPLYQTLTISPPRVITDAKKNGYLLLLGFDAPGGQDPIQAGYEQKAEGERERTAAQTCMGDEAKVSAGTGGASDHVIRGWIRSGDLLAITRGQAVALKSLTSRESTALARYQQWLTMPFDDWGFGHMLGPNCTKILLAHRLFLLEGFSQDLPTGLDRLEADIQAWRGALGQSKTLVMKMLAVAAVQDDASVVSGLLSRVDLDAPALARLSKMVRPLDQVELSVRWPMQSQFVWATKSVSSELKEDKTHDRLWLGSVAAALRLPVQRRANAYAEYYDAANKAVAGGRYMTLPKVSTFVHTSPTGVMDYLTNPVEHIVGIEPLPSWDPYVMRMIEADAQLRLAGLQAWLRRGPQDGGVLTRLAKAGQAYYDPFTGLPMLVNQRKGVIYSVGRDGKDQEGDDMRDVTAMLPALSASDARRTAVSASSR